MTGPRGIGNAMTVHVSGTSLDAQARYAQGTIKIIDNWRKGEVQNAADMIVENGVYVTGKRWTTAKPFCLVTVSADTYSKPSQLPTVNATRNERRTVFLKKRLILQSSAKEVLNWMP